MVVRFLVTLASVAGTIWTIALLGAAPTDGAPSGATPRTDAELARPWGADARPATHAPTPGARTAPTAAPAAEPAPEPALDPAPTAAPTVEPRPAAEPAPALDPAPTAAPTVEPRPAPRRTGNGVLGGLVGGPG